MNEIRGPETWDTPLGPSSDSKEIVNEPTQPSMTDSDMEKFRREAAKDILSGLVTRPEIYMGCRNRIKSVVDEAISLTDELIRQLTRNKK